MATDRGVDFRSRLRHALQTCTSASGEPYSYRELAAAIRAKGYDGPSAAYLNQLVTGVRSDPKLSYVQAIAAGLELPVSYFLTDADADPERPRVAPLGVELMAMRAGELSERGRRQVMEVLDLVYRLEHGGSSAHETE
ncbi:XRE family transcriptional regulator [Actinomycetospora sp. OC33-EN08]|uniref:XRE family transcriptional regulator n=1 Tax=Actinomycetospora aurantiaca TaxID=3129233 RepID=A0ABU8MSZ0_9PSEU